MDKIIDSIKCLAREKNLALFVGAGISKDPPSNLPLAGELKSYILEKLSSDEELKEIYASISEEGNTVGKKIRKLPFEIFLQVVNEGHDISKILDIFKRGEPNKNHILIARLMKRGYVVVVLTTNFDLLIEKALKLEGMKRHVDFQVYASELDFSVLFEPDLVPGFLPALSRLSHRDLEHHGLASTIVYKVYKNGGDDTTIRKLLGIKPRIFKLHGSADAVGGIRTTLSDIASQVFAEKRRLPVEHFFLSGEHNAILILGYSCSDEFDIAPMLRQLQSEKTIFFVEHDEQKENIFEIKNATKKDNGDYPFTNFHGKKIVCNTKKVLDSLRDEFIDEKWKCDEKPNEDWKNIVDGWSAEISQVRKFAIITKILLYFDEYDKAEKLLKESMVRYKRMSDMDGYYVAAFNLSVLNARRGRLDEAIKGYKEIITYRRKSRRPPDPDVLLNLGAIYEQDKWRKAAKYYKKARDIYKKSDDDIGYAKALKSLGDIYAEHRKWDKALKSYNESKEIFHDFGQLDKYSDALSEIGSVYLKRGPGDPKSVEQAIAFFKQSIENYKALVDMYSYSRALLGLGIAYFAQSRWEDAKKSFDECIQVSERDTHDVSTASEAREWLTKTITKLKVDLFRRVFHELQSRQ